jgi:hypothetical protein
VLDVVAMVRPLQVDLGVGATSRPVRSRSAGACAARSAAEARSIWADRLNRTMASGVDGDGVGQASKQGVAGP